MSPRSSTPRSGSDRASRARSKKDAAASRRARGAAAQDELMRVTLKACLIARDAAFNIRDLLTNSSRMAFLAIKDCEKELDQIERQIDEQLPGAITRVGEAKARLLFACLKFITDLERIGDLAYSAVMQLQSRREKLRPVDSRQLVEMASLLCDM